MVSYARGNLVATEYCRALLPLLQVERGVSGLDRSRKRLLVVISLLTLLGRPAL